MARAVASVRFSISRPHDLPAAAAAREAHVAQIDREAAVAAGEVSPVLVEGNTAQPVGVAQITVAVGALESVRSVAHGHFLVSTPPRHLVGRGWKRADLRYHAR